MDTFLLFLRLIIIKKEIPLKDEAKCVQAIKADALNQPVTMSKELLRAISFCAPIRLRRLLNLNKADLLKMTKTQK